MVKPVRRRWTILKAVLLILIYGQLLKLVFGGAALLVTLQLSVPADLRGTQGLTTAPWTVRPPG